MYDNIRLAYPVIFIAYIHYLSFVGIKASTTIIRPSLHITQSDVCLATGILGLLACLVSLIVPLQQRRQIIVKFLRYCDILGYILAGYIAYTTTNLLASCVGVALAVLTLYIQLRRHPIYSSCYHCRWLVTFTALCTFPLAHLHDSTSLSYTSAASITYLLYHGFKQQNYGSSRNDRICRACYIVNFFATLFFRVISETNIMNCAHCSVIIRAWSNIRDFTLVASLLSSFWMARMNADPNRPTWGYIADQIVFLLFFSSSASRFGQTPGLKLLSLAYYVSKVVDLFGTGIRVWVSLASICLIYISQHTGISIRSS